MEDLHGKWENFLRPTPRLTVRALKTVFFQAKNAFCLLKVASALLRGETKSYRRHLEKMKSVISLRGFLAACTNAMLDFGISAVRPSQIDVAGPTFDTPDAHTKVVKNNDKARASMIGTQKTRRLKNPATHIMVSTHDTARVPSDFYNKTPRCVVCCYKCYDDKGHVKQRTTYHRPVAKGQLPKPGLGREGYKTKWLCVTCGFVPLCRKVRFPGPDALTCWDYYHLEADLMDGRCETLCNVKNPRQMLGISTESMAQGTDRTAANLGNARPQAGAKRGRER